MPRRPAFARLARDGAFTGRVLDAGCGTGEHALLAASLGLSVVGVDVAPTAIETRFAPEGVPAWLTVVDRGRMIG